MEPSIQPSSPLDGPDPQSPASDLSGKTLGDFHLLRRLGQGGMGQVYLAEQCSLKRKVALKILRVELAQNKTSLQRFKAEGEAVARATHANIVQVYAVGEALGLHYMALEYVEGRNLREYLAKKGPPDLPLILGIMRQVAAALQRAAELGLIHRDIKPDNILLTRKGEVKVADFGLSRCLAGDQQPLHLTQSGVTMGTPLYMSPEQVEGKPVDHRADIYSFGVTCYHMVAGQPPFQGSNGFEVALKHVREEPTPLTTLRPDLPPDLLAIIQKMMAKDVGQRYQTCRDLLRDLILLRESLAGMKTEAISAVAAAASSGSTRLATTKVITTGRKRLGLAFAVSILLAIVVGGAFGMWYRARQAPPDDGAASANGQTDDFFASQKEREKLYLEGVKLFANPGSSSPDLEMGIKHRVALGTLYLNQWRLDDAERFFQELIKDAYQVPAYTLLGRVGEAVVLGLRNRAKDSIQRFQGIENALTSNRNLYLNAELRLWIAKAMDFNVLNADKQGIVVQERLKSLLREPPRQQAPPRSGKGAKKVGT